MNVSKLLLLSLFIKKMKLESEYYNHYRSLIDWMLTKVNGDINGIYDIKNDYENQNFTIFYEDKEGIEYNAIIYYGNNGNVRRIKTDNYNGYGENIYV